MRSCQIRWREDLVSWVSLGTGLDFNKLSLGEDRTTKDEYVLSNNFMKFNHNTFVARGVPSSRPSLALPGMGKRWCAGVEAQPRLGMNAVSAWRRTAFEGCGN